VTDLNMVVSTILLDLLNRPRIGLKAIALLRSCEDRLTKGLIPGGALKLVEVIGIDIGVSSPPDR
jgi:hypothetical protein